MKSTLCISTGACLSVLTLVSCGGGDGGLSSNSPVTTSASATPVAVAIDKIGNNLNPGVPGWPSYIAMGAIGGPCTYTPTIQPPGGMLGCGGGDNSFAGSPVDAVFDYAGSGSGDPGISLSPSLALRMTLDLGGTASLPIDSSTTPYPPSFISGVSTLNKGLNTNYPVSRVVMVEYTLNLSSQPVYPQPGGTGKNTPACPAQAAGSPSLTYDLTNNNSTISCYPNATYIMARHFVGLGADAMALAASPVMYNGTPYYGSMILNPDTLGTISQKGFEKDVNNALPAGNVTTAVKQALCTLTTIQTYSNNYNPNGGYHPEFCAATPDPKAPTGSVCGENLTSPYCGSGTYCAKSYSGTPVQIMLQMIKQGYPIAQFQANNWDGVTPPSTSTANNLDLFWDDNLLNSKSAINNWFNACVANPVYDTKYTVPNFSAGLDGWVQAHNWMIRTLAPKDPKTGLGVTFGWQENMFAASFKNGMDDYWLQQAFPTSSKDTVNSTYSQPVISWLNQNAPSAVKAGPFTDAPDFLVFDRYEYDDSTCPSNGCLYNARSWDNYITGVGLISQNFNNIPIMMWQIPGSHIPYNGEVNPETSAPGTYIFSTAPNYFFGDANLQPNLANIIKGPDPSNTNTAVGNYLMQCVTSGEGYICPTGNVGSTVSYLNWLNINSDPTQGNYKWYQDNQKLAFAAKNNIFAIMWGGGNTTNVIKNRNNATDNGYLAKKIINYYQTGTTPLQ